MWCSGKRIGYIIALTGLLIILSMILPSAFWWFVFGAILIVTGFMIMRR